MPVGWTVVGVALLALLGFAIHKAAE